ncbi:DUF2924 domain-containing protein [Porphyrobacter sp. SLTP]|uniref:DUF2924 domain-containing protein n=1 Tax=Porphyrobacter sp. SLTP TaxID=2683266 RepID=UPI00141219F0|nr:DUF2924 domain-containing protein [Porphyrobacter sp. SLTP]NBB25823.1 DUF2924 domain-containing protein [Porphyrobacter sp. SLTP]
MSRLNLQQQLEEIGSMDLNALRQAWRDRYGDPPSLRSTPMLQMMLAWRIQADAMGGLDADTRKALARTGAVEIEGRHLGVGARLSRTWKGRPVEVLVEEDGFRWDGMLYPSLSAAATAIAGSKWNGPRFFGLRDTP